MAFSFLATFRYFRKKWFSFLNSYIDCLGIDGALRNQRQWFELFTEEEGETAQSPPPVKSIGALLKHLEKLIQR